MWQQFLGRLWQLNPWKYCPHRHNPEPLTLGRTDPCSHVCLRWVLTPPFQCRSTVGHSPDQSCLVQFWSACPRCGLSPKRGCLSCSHLPVCKSTGMFLPSESRKSLFFFSLTQRVVLTPYSLSHVRLSEANALHLPHEIFSFDVINNSFSKQKEWCFAVLLQKPWLAFGSCPRLGVGAGNAWISD